MEAINSSTANPDIPDANYGRSFALGAETRRSPWGSDSDSTYGIVFCSDLVLIIEGS